jgi:hypothetical protein
LLLTETWTTEESPPPDLPGYEVFQVPGSKQRVGEWGPGAIRISAGGERTIPFGLSLQESQLEGHVVGQSGGLHWPVTRSIHWPMLFFATLFCGP